MHEQRSPGPSFGDRLRQARRAAGLTQEELAEQAGLSVRGISDLERGARNAPRRDTVEMLGAALGLPASEIHRWQRAARLENTGGDGQTSSRSLFGRDREINALLGSISSARFSQGSIVLIGGEPGVGKTSLAEHASAYAQHGGLCAVWGRCYDGEGAPAYWPWVQVFRTLIQHAAEDDIRRITGPNINDLAQILPELSQRWPDVTPGSFDGESARFRLFHAVSRLLHGYAEQQPLFIVLDDLQWADRSSLLLLEYLSGEMRHARIVLAGLYRDTEVERDDPLAATMLHVNRQPGNTHMLLGGIDADSVAGLINSLTDEAQPDEMADQLSEQTGGNPFFVSEIVRFVTTTASATDHRLDSVWRHGIPLGIRELIGQRLRRLSGDCQRTLSVASVIGRTFSVRILSGVSGVSVEQILNLLDEAVRSRLVEQPSGVAINYRFVHDLVRETIYSELSSSERLSLHADVGRTLERHFSSDPSPHLSRIAYHYTVAAPLAGHEPAVRYLVRAGEQAMEQIAYLDAARHFETAAELVEHFGDMNTSQGAELLLDLGEAWRRAGDIPKARETFQQAASIARITGDTEQLGRAAIGMAPGIVLLGRADPPAYSMLDEACTALGPAESKTLALCMARRALAYAGDDAESVATRLRLSAEALEFARKVDDTEVLAVALLARYRDLWTINGLVTDELVEIAAEAVAIAEQTGDPELLFTVLCWQMFGPFALGDIKLVDSLMDRIFRLAEELRQPFYDFMTTSLRAMRSVLSGDMERARMLTDRAWSIASDVRLPQRYDVVWRWVLNCQILRETGKMDELEEFARVHGDTFSEVRAHWRVYRAQKHLADVILTGTRYLVPGGEERDEHTDKVLELAGELTNASNYLHASHTRYALVHLAEAASILGDQQSADLLYKTLEPERHLVATVGGAFMCVGSVSRYLGMLATTLERWDDADRHYRDGLAMNERIGATLFATRTRYDWAEMLLKRGRPGDRERASELLDHVAATASDLNLPVLSHEAERLAQRLHERDVAEPLPGSQDPDFSGLTRRELEVLRLLARGHSNRQIADELFISVRTVENHVASILAKLEVSSRSAATRIALERGIAAE
jgi:DNA-binding CsgD family transcriptional regulator/transcriptional regulator with XRE-family HTH domain